MAKVTHFEEMMMIIIEAKAEDAVVVATMIS